MQLNVNEKHIELLKDALSEFTYSKRPFNIEIYNQLLGKLKVKDRQIKRNKQNLETFKRRTAKGIDKLIKKPRAV